MHSSKTTGSIVEQRRVARPEWTNLAATERLVVRGRSAVVASFYRKLRAHHLVPSAHSHATCATLWQWLGDDLDFAVSIV